MSRNPLGWESGELVSAMPAEIPRTAMSGSELVAAALGDAEFFPDAGEFTGRLAA